MISRSTFFTAILAVSLGVTLFVIKYQVQNLEDQLKLVDRKIVSERQSIHVLKAEWSHLNEAGRLSSLATRFLDLVPLGSSQFVAEGKFDERFRLPGEAQPVARTPLTFSERMTRALTAEVKK